MASRQPEDLNRPGPIGPADDHSRLTMGTQTKMKYPVGLRTEVPVPSPNLLDFRVLSRSHRNLRSDGRAITPLSAFEVQLEPVVLSTHHVFE